MNEVLLHIGGNVAVDSRRVIGICPYNLSNLKKIVKAADEEGKLVDISGRKKKNSVILLEDNRVFLSWVCADTLRRRFNQLFGD